uniref:(northern house mosquito) hypothetical protein n=1 Tax=Culex pipiens TaxID=7175 RepID=A0A8D8BU70_CULPI
MMNEYFSKYFCLHFLWPSVPVGGDDDGCCRYATQINKPKLPHDGIRLIYHYGRQKNPNALISNRILVYVFVSIKSSDLAAVLLVRSTGKVLKSDPPARELQCIQIT